MSGETRQTKPASLPESPTPIIEYRSVEISKARATSAGQKAIWLSLAGIILLVSGLGVAVKFQMRGGIFGGLSVSAILGVVALRFALVGRESKSDQGFAAAGCTMTLGFALVWVLLFLLIVADQQWSD